ncbi:hypothetical protein Tco_0489209 [Tanacetum coccineum]
MASSNAKTLWRLEEDNHQSFPDSNDMSIVTKKSGVEIVKGGSHKWTQTMKLSGHTTKDPTQAEFDEEERIAREKDEANIALTEEWNDI